MGSVQKFAVCLLGLLLVGSANGQQHQLKIDKIQLSLPPALHLYGYGLGPTGDLG